MNIFKTIIFILAPYILFGQIYTTINGNANFVSEAPMEIIKASSDQMQGVLDINKKTFAFKMYIKSFDGFNSPLQKVHFYENYLEANDYPIATFKGKLLEDISAKQDIYRAKGIFNLHGVSKEQIIEVRLILDPKKIDYESKFFISLLDYNIDLPRIVYQKIAEVIEVTVQGTLLLKE